MRKVTSNGTEWMDFLRGMAVIGIVIHHWLLFIPFDSNPVAVSAVDDFVKEVSGTGVQLFFVLSGCGLAVSYLKKGEPFLLGEWIRRRFRKIVLPYWIIVAGTFALANLASFEFGNQAASYSWLSLLAYILFMRNHYEPSRSMNPSLWFMPVIIGLYVLFPLLMRFLKRYGISRLLILAGLVTYGSITLFEFSGYHIDHQNAIFLFYLLVARLRNGVSLLGNLVSCLFKLIRALKIRISKFEIRNNTKTAMFKMRIKTWPHRPLSCFGHSK